MSLFMRAPSLFLLHLYCDFFEENYVFVTVILQAEISLIGPGPTLGLEIEFLRRHWIALGVFGDLHAIEYDGCLRAIQGISMVFHAVPGLPGRASGLGDA